MVFAISDELAMDYGLIPDTRPPLPKPSRLALWRQWRRLHLTLYALRRRLAAWIDPDDWDEDRW